ncbi:MAG: FecR domain-containing protein [Candidatus Omnitrophica bacterium]|nr:FecR domain-containing protein [Candidatus Omnitrophota bacterium]
MRTRKKKKVVIGRRWFRENQAVVIGVTLTLLAAFLAGGFLFRYSDDHARVLRLSGEAYVERGGDRIRLAEGMVLNQYDKILTGSGSSVEVTFDDKNRDIIRVGSDSRVVLESAVIERYTTIFMDRGDIILKCENLEKGSTLKVRTPVAVCGVRGTSFGIKLNGKDAVMFDYESKIFVKGLTRDFVEMDDELLLSEGWKVNVSQFEKPVRVEKITSDETAAWEAWLKEIAALSPDAGPSSALKTAHSMIRGVSIEMPTTVMSRFMINITSSISVIAFMLYLALAVNIGRVFL